MSFEIKEISCHGVSLGPSVGAVWNPNKSEYERFKMFFTYLFKKFNSLN